MKSASTMIISAFLVGASIVQAAPVADKRGLFGPDGPYGPGGEYGPNGTYGPCGIFGGPGCEAAPTAPVAEKRGLFGPHGKYGPDGEYGPHGKYGPDGEYGPHGKYGPDGEYGPDSKPKHNAAPTAPVAEKRGLFGPHGKYGPDGEYGPHGKYGPDGEYGPDGIFGPCGIFGRDCKPEHNSAPTAPEKRGLFNHHDTDNPIVLYWKDYKITGDDCDNMYDCLYPKNGRWPFLNDATCPELIDVNHPRPECFETDKKADADFKSCAKSNHVDLNKYKQ